MFNNTTGNEVGTTESDVVVVSDYFEVILPATIVGLISAIIGSFGNAWFILVIALIRSLQKANYRLVLGVVVSDCILNSIFIPFETLQTFIFIRTGVYVGTDTVCLFESPLFYTFLAASVVGQFLVALNRGTAVFKPILYRTYMTKRFVSIIFVIAAILFPLVFFSGLSKWQILFRLDRNLGDCIDEVLSPITNEIYYLLFYWIPTFGSLFVYVAIVFRIVLTTKSKRDEVIQRAKGSLTMFFCVLLFAICFLLFPISISMGIYSREKSFQIWINVLYRISFALNPVFYYFFDSALRNGSIEFWTVKIRKKELRQTDG